MVTNPNAVAYDHEDIEKGWKKALQLEPQIQNYLRVTKIFKGFYYLCKPFLTAINEEVDGLVAQLDNAPGYGPGDWGFESLRVHIIVLKNALLDIMKGTFVL